MAACVRYPGCLKPRMDVGRLCIDQFYFLGERGTCCGWCCGLGLDDNIRQPALWAADTRVFRGRPFFCVRIQSLGRHSAWRFGSAWERWFVLEDREAKRALVCIEILRRYEGLLMAMPWQMLGTCMWAVLERPRRDTNRGS